MADAVTTKVLYQDAQRYAVHFTNISDGTGESAVVKIDKSALSVASDGAEADSIDIESIRWNIQGFTSVRLLWDHDTDDVAMVLCGSGYEDFRLKDAFVGVVGCQGLKDPRSTGGTGDLRLTTNGGASGASYDITIVVRKNPS